MSRSERPTLYTVPPGAQNPTIPGSPVENWSPYLESAGSNAQRFRPYSAVNTTGPGMVPPEPMHTRSLSAQSAPPLPPRFPEPQLAHHSSYTPAFRPDLPPRPTPTPSYSGSSEDYLQRRESLESWNDSPALTTPDTESLSEELSSLTLESAEGLRRFQENLLPESEEEWHKLVPTEAREAFGKREVERQSVIFEIFKAEKHYVKDLRLIREVFMEPLRAYGQHGPPVMPPNKLKGFISEVFFNIDEIMAHHQRMLKALFQRQLEQHPLVQSVSDIVLDAVLSFRDEYESYIKHYPLAEARHRLELKRNREYQYFMQQATQDPRTGKHDLATFLNRPVTRLTRLKLVLEHLYKLTDPEHPDQETLPLMLNILSDFIKSTQPGVEAAGLKAKFWDLSESLEYMKGEIIDMDLYDERRTLNYSGTLARRQRSETDWRGWHDYLVALLDNYLLLTREETRSAGVIKRCVVSRPIPIEFLRLGAFDGPAEIRRERPDGGSILSRSEQRPMYPFVIYHAFSKTTRKYTLYAHSEASRERWHTAFRDALVVRKVSQESNMLFAPSLIDDNFFRVASHRVRLEAGVRFSGRVTCGTSFGMHGKKYLIIGCAFGIYVSQKGTNTYHKVFDTPNVTSVSALNDFNKLLVLYQGSLFYTPLDTLARVAINGLQSLQEPAPVMRRVTSADDNVVFFRVGKIGNRMLVIFAVKSLLNIYIHALEAISVDARTTAHRDQRPVPPFRTFGDPVSVPKDVHDITPLVRTIAICGERGILVADPTNLTKTVMATVPDFRMSSNNLPMSMLKSRCDNAKPLGIARCDGEELLVVYDEMGCFVDKHGSPTRKCGYARWEIKADSFVHRGRFLILFTADFIEVRDVNSARLVQVLEGEDIRLLEPVREPTDDILVAMHGAQDDRYGISQKLVELLETAEIEQSSGAPPTAWEEWDMA